MALLDAERARQPQARLEQLPPLPPDVPDPERPAPPQGAGTALDRAIGLAPARNVVERVRQAAAQGDTRVSPPRVPYEPPHISVAQSSPPSAPPAPWYARLWAEVAAAWRRL